MKLIKLKDVRHRGKEELKGWDVINTEINDFLKNQYVWNLPRNQE